MRCECRDTRVPLAINLELSHGRHGASARVELYEFDRTTVAVVSVYGWIDRVALRRLLVTLDDLSARGVPRLLLDGSRLRHIDYPLIALLVEALKGFGAGRGETVVCGLSRHLGDLFRLAGRPAPLSFAGSASELLTSAAEFEPGREWAS